MLISRKDTFSIILVLAALGVLLGRAYQHLFFEAPYRAFFLDEYYFRWAVRAFTDLTWVEYATSLEADIGISRYGRGVGWWLVMAAGSLFLIKGKYRMIPAALLTVSSLLLLFMAFCYHLDKGYQFAQIMEYTAQIFTPVLLLLYFILEKRRSTDFVLRAVIALTFLGHGLYAMGLYPVPGHFVHMVITNLGISNDQAVTLLYIAGWMDVGVAVGLFIPRLKPYWLAYALLWGFLTSLARLTTYVPLNHMFGIAIHQMGYEFLIRLPHFLLPLAGLVYLKKDGIGLKSQKDS